MKRFGHAKGFSSPKTEEQWTRIYSQHKYILADDVKALKLSFSSKGSGQTGARYFNSYKIPPIKHWNPNTQIEVVHERLKPIPPILTVMLKSNKIINLNISNKREEEIINELLHVGDTEYNVQVKDATNKAQVHTSKTQNKSKHSHMYNKK